MDYHLDLNLSLAPCNHHLKERNATFIHNKSLLKEEKSRLESVESLREGGNTQLVYATGETALLILVQVSLLQEDTKTQTFIET